MSDRRKPETSAVPAARKEYETPALEPLGTWRALTL